MASWVVFSNAASSLSFRPWMRSKRSNGKWSLQRLKVIDCGSLVSCFRGRRLRSVASHHHHSVEERLLKRVRRTAGRKGFNAVMPNSRNGRLNAEVEAVVIYYVFLARNDTNGQSNILSRRHKQGDLRRLSHKFLDLADMNGTIRT